MSDPKKDSPAKDESDNDLLAGVEEHLQDPDEGAKQAGEAPEDNDTDTSDGESETDNQEDEGESAEPSSDDEDDEPSSNLKTVVGRQANEIGELRKQLREMQEAGKPKQPDQPDPAVAKLESMRERWGDALVNDLQELISASVAPVREVTAIAQMRERYKDFDNVRGDMEEIMKSSPALRDAAKKDPAVLDTIYQAAVAKKSSDSSVDSVRRGEARSKEVNRQKSEAFVEKSSSKAPAQKKVSADDWSKGFVEHLRTLPPDGRSSS